jgi:hypothetical protein
METAIFTFPTDFVGETVPAVLARIRDTASVRGVTLAANYHTARDIFTHNPKHKVHVTHGGSLFLDAATAKMTRIGATCPQDPTASGEFSFPALVERAHNEGLRANGWLNLCHLDNFGVPTETLCQNVFGDFDYSTVCPSNADVVQFATALTFDVANAQPDQIVAEAIQFSPLLHGYHHERLQLEISELSRYLLGLCFCASCRAGMSAEGAAVPRLISAVRRCVEDELLAGPGAVGPLTEDDVVGAIGEDVHALWAHRSRAVLALADEISSAASAGGSSIQFVDPSGAMKGYATGRSTGAPGPVPGWILGADPISVARQCQYTGVLLYTDSLERVEEELEAWASAVADMSRLTAVLRPSLPDCRNPQDLVGKVRACRKAGVGGVSFYHYALFPLESLDWIRLALET